MKKRFLIAGALGIVVLAGAGLLTRTRPDKSVDLIVEPKEAAFQVVVTASGELKAKNSVKVMGPSNARQARVYEIKILRLVPEGTVVQKGDFVAELDRSEVQSRLKDTELNLQKAQSQYEQTALDTALTLSRARDEQVTLNYSLEEARLRHEQAAFEAPSIRRQAEIDYEKSQRSLQQARINYKTQTRQAIAKMQEVEAELRKQQKEYDEVAALAPQFTVMAPENGMVIYRRDWRGDRTIEGSTVSAWEPVVAELPDLSSMESITYVNEVDIQKIKVGQRVQVGLDADPEKKLTGKVVRVANIGEQRPNSDSKVFEVAILLDHSDKSLRPAMTTSNSIVISEIPKVLQIPLETVHTTADSTTFVYVKRGSSILRQEVRLGLLNDNAAIVQAGLNKQDHLFLSTPPDTTGIKMMRLRRK